MLATGSDYAEHDRRLARNFASAAAATPSMKRIVYLGGLGETGADLSEHLSSRREVERELASGSVPVTTLRAAMIIGSGSASFEILRYLVERLPVMVTPRWVQTESQPIAVSNVLEYLVRSPRGRGDQRPCSRHRGSGRPLLSRADADHDPGSRLPRRLIVPVPVLTPRLSSLWIHLVTPLSHRIARPLAEGLRNRVVCKSTTARDLMPQELLSVREAIDAALGHYEADSVETSWTDAGPIPGDPDWAGGKTFVDSRVAEIDAAPADVFRAVCRIGGGNGWYAADLLWRLRGWIDRLVGGPGLRRGRRDSERLAYGDALDFWRVTGIEAGRRLALRAEMKLPGEALLEFEIERQRAAIGPHPDRALQTSRLAGLLYWTAVLPFHGFVFRGMIQGIRRFAEALPPTAAAQDEPTPSALP